MQNPRACKIAHYSSAEVKVEAIKVFRNESRAQAFPTLVGIVIDTLFGFPGGIL